MKKSRKTMPPQYREVCRAVCAIVHANINENCFFKQSPIRAGISAFRRNSFADNGVIIELNEGNLKIKAYIDTMIGEESIILKAVELQRNIAEEIVLLTSIPPKEIDLVVVGIKGKKI